MAARMDTERLVRAFKALSNENRIKILEAIKNSSLQCACHPQQTQPSDGGKTTLCCVDEIVGQFDMAQSTISQHLKELHNAGLLERHKRAQWVYYTVNRRTIEELSAYLGNLAAELVRSP
jgi:DNA-binding transcriptional ArsR family regulator